MGGTNSHPHRREPTRCVSRFASNERARPPWPTIPGVAAASCLERVVLTDDDMDLLAGVVESRPAVRRARARLEEALERYRRAPTRAKRAARLKSVEHARKLWHQAIRVEAGAVYDQLWPGSP